MIWGILAAAWLISALVVGIAWHSYLTRHDLDP